MTNLFSKLFNRLVSYDDSRRVLNLTRKLIRENWDTASTVYLSIAPKPFNFEKRFVLGQLEFYIFRGIRADLIKVKFVDTHESIVESDTKESVVEFVDQSHQFHEMMGVNDVHIKIKYKRFLNAIQTINPG